MSCWYSGPTKLWDKGMPQRGVKSWMQVKEGLITWLFALLEKRMGTLWESPSPSEDQENSNCNLPMYSNPKLNVQRKLRLQKCGNVFPKHPPSHLFHPPTNQSRPVTANLLELSVMNTCYKATITGLEELKVFKWGQFVVNYSAFKNIWNKNSLKVTLAETQMSITIHEHF